MQAFVKFDDRHAVAGRLSPNDMREIARKGFRAVVNLRHPEAQKGGFSVVEEGQAAERAGLAYANIPVSTEHVGSGDLDRFRAEISTMAPPILVHCESGSIAGAFVAAYKALGEGSSGQEAVATAREKGVELSHELDEFVRAYVDSNRTLAKAYES